MQSTSGLALRKLTASAGALLRGLTLCICLILCRIGFSQIEGDLRAPADNLTARRAAENAGSRGQLEALHLSQQTLASATALFEPTVRSCLGTRCFQARVPTSMGEVTRVGVLMPDPVGRGPLLQMLVDAGAKGSGSLMELEFFTNVPPYGYGKNHGWSKIIRVVRQVLPNAASLVKDHPHATELMEPQVQQLLRWHCRLSHVAAHTAMHTVWADDLLAQPNAELGKIVTFAGGVVERAALQASVEAHLPALRRAWTEPSASGSALAELYEKGLQAMRKEMASTKNMTRWPCRSFRDFANKQDAAWLPLPVPALAANCSAPHTKCSVRFDIDEFRRSEAAV